MGAALVVGMVTFASRDARADDPEGARNDFAEGVRLLQIGDFVGARRSFKSADAKHHAPAIVYNLGLAEERLGHMQAAVDAYEAYVSETGDSGELSAAAAVAIAQVKTRSTRLRIGTSPMGARIFVDGTALAEPSPTVLLVSAGHHVIVAEANTWRGEQDVEARGTGDVVEVIVKASAPVPAPRPDGVTDVVGVSDPRPPFDGPDGLVWGATFALVPFHLLGAPNKDKGNGLGATQMAAGGIVEIGYALTDRVALLARSLIAFGPDAKPTTLHMSGIGLSIRAGSHLWLGASFIGGQLATRAKDANYQTNLVFGTILEASVAVITTRVGEWMVGFQPGLLLATEAYENAAFVFPFTFGFRAF